MSFSGPGSARVVATRTQLALLLLLIGGVAAALTLRPLVTLTVAFAAGTSWYVCTLTYKAVLVTRAYRADSHGSLPRTLLPWDELPRYTILVPLYREANVVQGLVGALSSLEYPGDRLEVLLLVEEEDQETADALRRLDLPPYAHLVVCPDGQPRTKPRACNVGLSIASGDLVVVYDAEDRPEPDQLWLVASLLAELPEDVVCVQARLDYHNSDQNLLTRMFTVEYNHWFGALLPALADARLPIPLGGTSNHFRADALERLGGWDAWNVTEDADLGIRLFASGSRTAVIDSITWEEACSQVRPWIRQRTRWVKGYAQTTLVHTRSLAWLARAGKQGRAGLLRSTAAFLAFLPGTVAVNVMNPVFAGVFVWFLLTRADVVTEIIPAPWVWLSVLTMTIGNTLLVYMSLIEVSRRRRWHLGLAALLTPVYWALHSVATYRALWQLFRRPHLWEKTPHGLGVDTTTPDPTLELVR
jgi:cellulose synthase/poly-beta-1,6-N-acetylglucosamine synthase-like glycosyltransferase